MLFSGKQLRFENDDRAHLKQMREWFGDCLKQFQTISTNFITSLSALAEQRDGDEEQARRKFDFDLQVKILQIVKLDRYTAEMRVVDGSGEIWHCHVLNQKFKSLAEGQTVRIRQATIQNHKSYERVFGLKSHSNILTLPKACSLLKSMKTDEKSLVPTFEKSHLLESVNGLQHPVLLSSAVLDKAQLISLRQVMDVGVDPNVMKGPVKARFHVTEIHPAVPEPSKVAATYVKVLNENTLAARAYKPAEKLKKGEKLVLHMSLLAKDASLMSLQNFARIDLVHTGPSDFFAGLSVADLVKPGTAGQEAQTKLHFALTTMTKFNAYLETGLKITTGAKGTSISVCDAKLKTFK